MTTRRNLLIVAGGAAAAGITFLGTRVGRGTAAPTGAAPFPDVLLAESDAGLVVIGGARPGSLGRRAAAGADGRYVYAVAGSDLVKVDPVDGATTRNGMLGGGWLPRVVSGDGRACALARTAAAPVPAGRPRSELLVTTGTGRRTYGLPGVVEPDAFTADDTGLFVLVWQPASAPDAYRVRLLDLATGAVGPLLTRTKTAVPANAEEQMRGEGRLAVLSPDRNVLYTLYTHQPGHRHTRDLLAGRPSGAHAFVHVLHLVDRWAYCLDLPHPFGAGPPAGHAIAVTADGKEIAVLDATSGSIVYADTAALEITGSGILPAGSGTASVVYTPDRRRVLAGAGDVVTVLDRATGSAAGRWPVPGVRGLGVGRDGTSVYCGGNDEVLRLDAGSGAILGRAPVPGLLTLRSVR